METWIWELYEKEIKSFQKMAHKLLVQVIVQELKIDKKKHQNLEPSEEDVDQYVEKFKLMLKTLAVTETLEFFQVLRILPTNQNRHIFYAKYDERFENLLMQINSKLTLALANVNF